MADMTSRAEIGITGILGWTTVYCYQATRHVPSYHNHVFSLTESKHSGKKKNKRQKHWCWRKEDKERRPSTNGVYSLSHFCMWKLYKNVDGINKMILVSSNSNIFFHLARMYTEVNRVWPSEAQVLSFIYCILWSRWRFKLWNGEVCVHWRRKVNHNRDDHAAARVMGFLFRWAATPVRTLSICRGSM